jgi:hypothetical protein
MEVNSTTTTMSSEACGPPSQVPVGAEDEDSMSSYHFPLFETFESPA